MAAADWSSLWPEDRHLLHVIAVSRRISGGAVMSHVSAAVLWGLPLYRLQPKRVHVTCEPDRISSRPDVFRHMTPLPSSDVTERGGIRCTTLARTVFDVTRMLTQEQALSCADAAERLVAWNYGEWDEDAAWRWRGELDDRASSASGSRGIRQARLLLPLVDGRAQLPGESVLRLQLIRLGYQRPRLQVYVPGPQGRAYFVDGALDEVRTFYEFDGRGKYEDEAMRAGRTLAEVLLAEKQREDWIRGSTQWRLVRAEDPHIGTPAAVAARLRSFGIPLP